jgi:hypothetical protein
VSAALAVAAVLVAALAVRALRRALPPLRDRGAAGAARSGEESGDLASVQRRVATGTVHAGDLHLRLRPVLREVASEGLRRRGVDLDGEPARAEGMLAPDTWELVRPDRPRPDDPFAPGLAPRRLDVVLDDLEALLS